MDIEKNGMYFVRGIKELIIAAGGTYSDHKERPIVALLQSAEHSEVFWAIPLGDLSHRNQEQMNRLQSYLSAPREDIRSCFYHIGNTNKRTLFFISDVFPITSGYIEREYLTYNQLHYVIKNKPMLAELERKLKRILSYEKSKILQSEKFYFRQNIFGVYNRLLELDDLNKYHSLYIK